jgi:hypothetical protein
LVIAGNADATNRRTSFDLGTLAGDEVLEDLAPFLEAGAGPGARALALGA